MMMRGTDFEVDRANGKLLGVCAGIANKIGVDATFVRVGFVLAAILISVQWTLVGYGVLFLVGKAGGYCAASTFGCRRSKPMSPAPIPASRARSKICADPDRTHLFRRTR
jgi:phage shock protein PspC (stress-responsive transcriptional regulator)